MRASTPRSGQRSSPSRAEDRLLGGDAPRRINQEERNGGLRPGLTTEERQRLKELERENRELSRANEILRKASAYFA